MKKVLKIIALILAAIVGIVAVGLLVLTIAEYRPRETETVVPDKIAGERLHVGDTVRVVSWNLGYGALGDNADFFMDGGKMVETADTARVQQNLSEIRDFLDAEMPHLAFLQETDLNSDRSHHIDEREALSAAFPGYESLFAYNFNALYVPYPLPPIGHVESGLVTYSVYPSVSASRIQLPCPFSWPIRLANLKRCLLVSRIPVMDTDKELVAVNLHLEAYDDGSGKAAQTAMLAEFLKAELDKGNYVICGGDFNQIFSSADQNLWPVREGMWAPGVIDVQDFDPRLSLLMDDRTPSCRSLDQPYAGADPAAFQFYLIDGFIVSNNLTVERFENVSLNFKASDHNPVRLTVTLNE